MPDFDPPFADQGERRVPTVAERQNGFPCGPADQSLFNGMMHLLEGQFKHLGDQAGVTPSGDNDHTFNFRAIEALISAATGGGDTSQFLLVSQAQARLPIFPEILTSDGRINVTSPGAGTVRIPAGVDFLHRGIFPITTVQTDFATDASKIYHIRWSLANGYEMKDLALSGYNPGSLGENASDFDSTYDDMLIARVITNSSNIASITNLANKNKLFEETQISGTPTALTSSFNTTYSPTFTINWGRRPGLFVVSGYITTSGAGALERPQQLYSKSKNRYWVDATIAANWNEGSAAPSNLSAVMNYGVGA